MQKVKQLMMDKWGMERPNLLISVTGGAKNFQMRGRLKDAFRRGLMKAALSTGNAMGSANQTPPGIAGSYGNRCFMKAALSTGNAMGSANQTPRGIAGSYGNRF